MSVVVVKYRLRNAHVLSVDEFNENFYALASEIDGKLNEHNFQYEAFSTAEDVTPGDIYSWSSTGQICDPFFDWVSPTNHHYQREPIWVRSMEGTEWAVNSIGTPVEITNVGVWIPITDMTQTVTTSSNGWFWIIASFQHDHDTDIPTGGDGSVHGGSTLTREQVVYSYFGGANYGIRLNGQLIQESVLGGLDWTNDTVRAFGRFYKNTQSSSGILWPATPLVCDALVEIPPGRHQIELVVYVHPAERTKAMWVTNRELIVLKVGK